MDAVFGDANDPDIRLHRLLLRRGNNGLPTCPADHYAIAAGFFCLVEPRIGCSQGGGKRGFRFTGFRHGGHACADGDEVSRASGMRHAGAYVCADPLGGSGGLIEIDPCQQQREFISADTPEHAA